VSFYECGPTQNEQSCTSQANEVGTTPVSLIAGDNDTATADSVAFTAHSTGYYCFDAVYSGDSNYGSGSDSSTDECFAVTAASTLTQSAPSESVISLGQSDSDAVTVTGNASGGSPTGSIAFYECGPNVSAQSCTSETNAVGTVSLSSTTATTSSATSGAVTPASAGYWCFYAVYSGDSNYSGSSDSSTNECFDVTAASSSTSSTPSASTIVVGTSVTDAATVTGNSIAGNPSGSVSFYECGPSAGAQSCTSEANQIGSAVAVSAGANNTSTATSASFTPDATGTWCFGAYYSGDSSYATSSDTSTQECFKVTEQSSTTTSHPATTTMVLGATETDSATVTGNATGGNPTGNVAFYECGPTTSATPCTSQANEIGSAVAVSSAAGSTSTATSASFTPHATGYYCFAAYYLGSAVYGASSDTSTAECFDVTIASSSTMSTPQYPSINLGASNATNVSVTGNAGGSAPTGSAKVYICGPSTSPSSCTSTTGTKIGKALPLTPGSGDVSTATSTFFTPTASGYWCFAAYYAGSTNYAASSDTSSLQCFFVEPSPEITSFSPASGPIGTKVTIKGTNLSGATVDFGKIAGTIVSNSATVIKVDVPASARNSYITVTTSYGSATTVTKFKVTS
jgi:hypothetical protein